MPVEMVVSKAEIRYSAGAKTFAILVTIFFIVIDIAAPLTVQAGMATRYTTQVAIIFLGITLFGVVMCSEFFLTWYQVDDEGIRNHGIWRRHFFVRWDEIDRMDSVGTKGNVLVDGRIFRDRTEHSVVIRSGKVKFKLVFNGMTGTPEFVVLAKRHLPEEIWKKGFTDSPSQKEIQSNDRG
jgi:hypothetical protein